MAAIVDDASDIEAAVPFEFPDVYIPLWHLVNSAFEISIVEFSLAFMPEPQTV